MQFVDPLISGDATHGTRATRRRSQPRGSTILFSLMVVMMMMIGGMALVSGTLQATRISRIQQEGSAAFNLAESGAERAALWLRAQSQPPAGTGVIDPFGGPVALGDGTYRVVVDPADTNAPGEPKRYIIQSTGVAGERQETVELYVQVASFGRYAYFTDSELSSISNSPIRFIRGDVVDGPVHSNNTDGSFFTISYGGSTAPIFRDRVTAAGASINYLPSAPGTEAEFLQVFQEGSRGFQTGVDRIELPDSTDLQKTNAWGATTSFPTDQGVHFPAIGSMLSGGIYICGDCTLLFSVTPEGHQRIQIGQGAAATTVTVDRTTEQTVVTKAGVTTTYSGAPNGVLYSTGNVTAVSGQLGDNQVSGSQITSPNAWTVATDVVAGKSVTITDNLTYKTVPDKTKPADDIANLRAAALGIVARNIVIAESAPTNLTVHGVMLAGGRNTTDGSFHAAGWNSRSVGTLNLLGGLIQKKRGPVGTADSEGNISTGYRKSYTYDARMLVDPPPYFPTTGKYDRLSWRRLSAGAR